jgi:hypothetical protein
MTHVALLAAVLGMLTPASACGDPLDKLVAGLPKDAAAVVRQLAMCNHFAGEEAYDKARAREIARAIRQYKCDSLERDEATVRKRYATDPKIVKALDDAKHF